MRIDMNEPSNSPPVDLSLWAGLLTCPRCHGQLQANNPTQSLMCPACSRSYPLREGVVRCLGFSSDDPFGDIKQQEIDARDKSASKYESGIDPIRSRIEIDACLDAMGPVGNDIVAELGCGTGRITTQYVSRIGRVVAVDFSLESLYLLRDRLPPEHRERVLLVQADISSLPLAHYSFSKVVSFQVIEHLPSHEQRADVFRQVASLLRRNGAFIFTVYNWSIGKQRLAQQGIGDNTKKEGYHNSGIYYYNFEIHEIYSIMHECGLQVDWVRGLIVPFRGASVLGKMILPLNRWLSMTEFGRRRAQLLLVHGRHCSPHPPPRP